MGRARPWLTGGALIVCAVPLILGSSPAFADNAPVSGGGSNFAALLVDQWRADVAREPYNLPVGYTAQGSTFGRNQFAAGSLDFGVSDLGFPDGELLNLQATRCVGRALSECFTYVPIVADGLSFMFNLVDAGGNRINDLRLSRRAACKIFTGAITRWDDPELVATNPQLAGLARAIVPIIRSEAAGESDMFSEYCQTVAPDVWQAFINEREADDPGNVASDFAAGKPVAVWPENWGHSIPLPFADNVAIAVDDPAFGRNAIAYTASFYARVRNAPLASLENASGSFVQPDPSAVSAGLPHATDHGDGLLVPDDTKSDTDAYYPALTSYVIAQTTGFDLGKGATLGQFLCYAIGKGQQYPERLRTTPLPPTLIDIAARHIAQIPGAPTLSTCEASVPPPSLPEAPITLLPPLAAIAIGGISWRQWRRKHRNSAESATH